MDRALQSFLASNFRETVRIGFGFGSIYMKEALQAPIKSGVARDGNERLDAGLIIVVRTRGPRIIGRGVADCGRTCKDRPGVAWRRSLL